MGCNKKFFCDYCDGIGEGMSTQKKVDNNSDKFMKRVFTQQRWCEGGGEWETQKIVDSWKIYQFSCAALTMLIHKIIIIGSQ